MKVVDFNEIFDFLERLFQRLESMKGNPSPGLLKPLLFHHRGIIC